MGLIKSIIDKFSVMEDRPTVEEVKETASAGERDIVDHGDGSCPHQMKPHDWYDLPDPDPRNPIRVKKCERCPREVHITTPAGSTSTIDIRYTQ